MKQSPYYDAVSAMTVGVSSGELRVGYCRYEAIRKLNARQFKELCDRNLKGERFDDMVDELILKNQ